MNQLPKTETRCTEIFSDTLRGYAGIQEVEYDYTNGNLKAVFDPHKISSERALEVVQHAGREASMRVAQCAAKRERGEEACAQCVGELAEQLAKQYESAATLPTATFRKNTLEVKLETSNLLSSEDNKVEASFFESKRGSKKTCGNSHRKNRNCIYSHQCDHRVDSIHWRRACLASLTYLWLVLCFIHHWWMVRFNGKH